MIMPWAGDPLGLLVWPETVKGLILKCSSNGICDYKTKIQVL